MANPRIEEAPTEFCCPITFGLMKEPVVNAAGHTYEKSALQRWYAANSTDPMTRKNLTAAEKKILIPNHNLKSQIEEWKQKHKPHVAVPATLVAPQNPAANVTPSSEVKTSSVNRITNRLQEHKNEEVESDLLSEGEVSPADVEIDLVSLLEEGEISQDEYLTIMQAAIAVQSHPPQQQELKTDSIARVKLFLGILNENVDEVKTALSQGVDVNARQPLTGESALMVAVYCNNINLLRMLCRHGADIDIQDASGKTALHHALYAGKEDCCQFLLSKGANTALVDTNGMTAEELGIVLYGDNWKTNRRTNLNSDQSSSTTVRTQHVEERLSSVTTQWANNLRNYPATAQSTDQHSTIRPRNH